MTASITGFGGRLAPALLRWATCCTPGVSARARKRLMFISAHLDASLRLSGQMAERLAAKVAFGGSFTARHLPAGLGQVGERPAAPQPLDRHLHPDAVLPAGQRFEERQRVAAD